MSTVDSIIAGIEKRFLPVLTMGTESDYPEENDIAAMLDLVIPVPFSPLSEGRASGNERAVGASLYAFAKKYGKDILGFVFEKLKSRGDMTPEEFLEEIRKIVEKEVKDALNSQNQEQYSLKISSFETWFLEVYKPMRESGIIDADKLADSLNGQIEDNLIPAQVFFRDSSPNDPDRPKDCIGLYLYAMVLRVLCYQELFALSVPNPQEDDLPDKTDPVLRRNLYSTLIQNVVDQAHNHYDELEEDIYPYLFDMPILQLLVDNLELYHQFIHADDGQSLYPACYGLIKEQMDEGSEKPGKVQTWDRIKDTSNCASHRHFSYSENGIQVNIPGNYIVRAYIQEPYDPGTNTIMQYDFFVESSTGNRFWPNDAYDVESHRKYLTGGTAELVAKATRRNIEQIDQLGAGELLQLNLGKSASDPDTLNSIGFSLEMPRLEEAFHEKWVGDFRNNDQSVEEGNELAAPYTRLANWGDSDDAGGNFTGVAEYGRGIWVNSAIIPYNVEASLRVKTGNSSSTEVGMVLVAAKSSGEVVNLADLLGRDDLKVTQTVDGNETEIAISATGVQLQNYHETITLGVRAGTDLVVTSGRVRMETASTHTEVSGPEMMRRDDGLSSYILAQKTWEIDNLDAHPESGRRPNDYLTHLSDVGASLDRDIALNYVASVSLPQEIHKDSGDVDHYFCVRAVLFEHKNGEKDMIASRNLFPGKKASEITPSELGVLGVERFNYEGAQRTSFSVEIYASHKMDLSLSTLLTLPVNDPGNLP